MKNYPIGKVLSPLLFTDSKLQSGLVARYQLNEEDTEQVLRSPDFPCENPLSEQINLSMNAQVSQSSTLLPDFSSLSKTWHSSNLDSDEIKQNVEFMKIQAQVGLCVALEMIGTKFWKKNVHAVFLLDRRW